MAEKENEWEKKRDDEKDEDDDRSKVPENSSQSSKRERVSQSFNPAWTTIILILFRNLSEDPLSPS